MAAMTIPLRPPLHITLRSFTLPFSLAFLFPSHFHLISLPLSFTLVSFSLPSSIPFPFTLYFIILQFLQSSFSHFILTSFLPSLLTHLLEFTLALPFSLPFLHFVPSSSHPSSFLPFLHTCAVSSPFPFTSSFHTCLLSPLLNFLFPFALFLHSSFYPSPLSSTLYTHITNLPFSLTPLFQHLARLQPSHSPPLSFLLLLLLLAILFHSLARSHSLRLGMQILRPSLSTTHLNPTLHTFS